MTAKVIRTLEDADEHDPNERAVVEVPSALVGRVLFLMRALDRSGNSKRKKMAKALLSTAAAAR